MHLLLSPLSVRQSAKKMFVLNMNIYRNSHFRTLAKTKKLYGELMAEQVRALPKMEKVILHYQLYPKSHRLTDLDNVCSIHAKYIQDCLVYWERIPEDNYKFVIGSTQEMGVVDKINPRMEVRIEEIK